MLNGINNNFRQQMYFKSNFSMNDENDDSDYEDEIPLDDRMPDRMPDKMPDRVNNTNKGNNSNNYSLEINRLCEAARTYLIGINNVVNVTESEHIAQMIREGLEKRIK